MGEELHCVVKHVKRIVQKIEKRKGLIREEMEKVSKNKENVHLEEKTNEVERGRNVKRRK